jgi:hypothetical protein
MRNDLLTFPVLRGALTANVLLNVLICGVSSHAAASDASNNLSLARAFPVEKLATAIQEVHGNKSSI